MVSTVGLVVIGRNEGDRLKRCLQSVREQVSSIVYVDSGSTDGSVAYAQGLGVEVVALDLSVPFTAARARNAGFARLQEIQPDVEFVQFVDGDCEIVPTWWAIAENALKQNPELVVVCGRRRERFPERSIFNRLCDLEWDTPIGSARACGGDALMRVSALEAVGGFNPDLIAGEEPELCIRLRRQGGKIERLDAEMTLHDAAMTRWGQWWQRNVRGGHSFAQVSAVQASDPIIYQKQESRRIWLWGLLLPVLAVGLSWLTQGWSLLLFVIYPLQMVKIYRNQRSRDRSIQEAWLYAFFCVLGRFPQLQGQVTFYRNRWQGQKTRLIEYKAADS
jgi:glycosyltransferase involved in cell wall biosynthesis